MKVVGRKLMEDFAHRHAGSRAQVDSWLCETKDANWKTPYDIKARFPSASFLSDNRVVFNLKGNRYRLDTKISYEFQIVFIKRIGTHSEYSKWKF